jgi:hypothetical protein
MLVGSLGNSYAITNGQPDEYGHPYVGAILFLDESYQFLWFCSGALISPTVVLTAGHCTDGATYALVSFHPEAIEQPETFIWGYPYTHPDFRIGFGHKLPGFDTHDVGVVELWEDAPITTYVVLPSVGLVDTLPRNTDVTIVGYGVQYQTRGIPPHEWEGQGVRLYAPSRLVPSNDVISGEFIKLTANPGKGKGGVCFGDSGGPDLLGNIILSTNSFMNNYNCTGVVYSNRIDTPDVLGWLESWIDATNP